MSDVTVYGRSWCEDTQATIGSLQRLGVHYDYIDIEADAQAAQYVSDVNNGKHKTPTVLVRGEVLVEPDENELGGMLRATGLMA